MKEPALVLISSESGRPNITKSQQPKLTVDVGRHHRHNDYNESGYVVAYHKCVGAALAATI